MRVIRGVALGTYFAPGAESAKASPKASDMRGLVYAIKDNRKPSNPPQLVAHSRHPATPPGVRVDRSNAVAYVAAIINRHLPQIRRRLAIERGALLIPVPSSEVVRRTLETSRFPALRVAQALESIGLGECRPLADPSPQITPRIALISFCSARTSTNAGMRRSNHS